MTASARTWPYRRPDRGRVAAQPWRIAVEGGATLGESLDHWDPSTDLHLSRRVQVDASALRTDCGYDGDVPLRLVASWWCEGTTLRGHGTRVAIPASGTLDVAVELLLDAPQLSGVVHLQTSVVLARRLQRKPLTAHVPGSVLWEQSHTLRLEGSGARFPMDAISFKASGPDFPLNAAWRLEWEPDDLELPVLGGVRLHVNTDHALMASVIEKPEDPRSQLVVAAMQFDVARTMLRGALERDDFVNRRTPWPPDSVGKVLERLLQLRFSGFNAVTLQAKLRTSPETFDALLQDRLGLFRVGA